MRKSATFLTALLALSMVIPAANARVKERDLRTHIEILASDEFEGRKPGTDGEKKTIEYISRDWAKSGLKPAATNGTWYDHVPLVERKAGTAGVSFTMNGRKLRFADTDIVLLGTKAVYSRKSLPVFFAGSGVGTDGKPVGDVAGKIVFMLVEAGEHLPKSFRSVRVRRKAMIDAGAEAIILIADDEPGKWNTLRRRTASPSRPNLVTRENRAPLRGAVSTQYIVGLASAAKQDWDELSREADNADFTGKDLQVAADFEVSTKVRHFNSHNVIGKLPGKKKNSGAVLYLGHWDHLGICRPEGAEDRICNGAVDNASGIAVLSEVARRLGKKRHDRDIYFVATTAEESGLLGAYSFAENPAVPLKDIVVALNVDTIAIAPKGAKVAIIGRGETPLDPHIEKIARKLKRDIESSTDANAFIRRQDGWALAAKGVPALMVGGSFADLDLLQDFLGKDYHGPGDELTDETELGGAAEDADLHIALGKYFASKRKYR